MPHASRPLRCERRGLSAPPHNLRRRVAARSPRLLRKGTGRTACPAAAGRRAGRPAAGSPCLVRDRDRVRVRVRVRFRVRFRVRVRVEVRVRVRVGVGVKVVS